MISLLDLVVIIPVYNEGDVISLVITEWLEELNNLDINFEIHAYNDGSKDNTAEVLNDLAQQYSQLKVFNQANKGHGPTILNGYKQVENATWIFQVDSDREMSPEYFKDLWSKKDKYDFLFAHRIAAKRSIARKIISKIASWVIKLFFGNKIDDVNAPYRLMKASTLQPLLCNISNDALAPNIMISALANHCSLTIFKTNVPYTFRSTGEVSIKQWKLFWFSCRIFVQLLCFRLSLFLK